MDVHFWKLKQQQREEDDDSPEHRGRSIGNAHERQNAKKKHRTRCWLRWAGAPTCLREDHHRALIYREFVDRVEGRGILVDPVLAEAHWHMEQVENHASYLRVTMEDVDTDEADFQHGAGRSRRMRKTILCNTMDTCRENGSSAQHRGFQSTFLTTTQICHSWSLRAGSGNRPRTDTNVGWQRSKWKPTKRSEREY